MAARKRTRASKGGGRNGGIATRAFKEIRSSLDSLRDLMESYMPAGRAGSKRPARGTRRKPAAATASKPGARRASRKSKGRARRGAKV
jgi:hypothetical protein